MKICKNYETMFKQIIQGSIIYLLGNKIKSLIIGISGGIDSALCAALANEVCKRLDNGTKIIGRSLPISGNKDDEIQRSLSVGQAFCHDFEMESMTKLYTYVSLNIVKNLKKGIIRKGNIKARLRMIKLFDLANKQDGLVLSTDNYTEYLLGFWTLHGDVGNFGMIQNLWKTEAYGLSRFLVKHYEKNKEYYKSEALKECINAVPTDGLGITKSDFDQILPNYDKNLTPEEVYAQIDNILINMQINDNGISNQVIQRSLNTNFKRNDPFNIPREYIIGEVENG